MIAGGPFRSLFGFATTLLSVCVFTAVAMAQATAWTEDRGEEITEADLLTLGEDVAATIGPPAGPPLDGAVLDKRTTALASTLRCPVCQGLSIQDSTSESARNMRRQVQAMLAAGYDEDQVLRYFEHSYGEFIRLLPRAEGFNLVVWALPIAALFLGFLGVVRVVKGSVRTQTATTRVEAAHADRAADPDPDQRLDETVAEPSDDQLDPWVARVRRELANHDG